MRDTIPQYQAIAGLNFKAFSFAKSDGHYGGIYLWKDLDAARAWFTPQWFERVSLGAHHAAMTDAETQARIDTVVSVAAGSGYWRDWATPSRRLAPLMLHLAAPLLTPLLGYFPGKALRMVGDLPGPAMRQWTRWCRHPDFAWGAEPDLVRPSLQSARFRIEGFSFTDDDAMTENCTRKLLAAMPNALSNLHMIEPQALGLPAIGHVGAFRPQASQTLWPLFEQSMVETMASGGSTDG